MTKTKEVIIAPKEYNCLCTKCGHDWTSSGKPTKCPNCGSKQITYSEGKEDN
jgi:Zn finger protein HypA/HybF involved in hydrogenase expression